MVRATWIALGVYFVYLAGLIGVNALVATRDPTMTAVSASLAAIALALPLVPLKRHGLLSP